MEAQNLNSKPLMRNLILPLKCEVFLTHMQACIEEEGWAKKMMSGRHDGHGQVGLKNFIETIWIENFQAVLSCYFATKV